MRRRRRVFHFILPVFTTPVPARRLSPSLGITDGFEFGQVPPSEIFEFCRRNWNRNAEGLFVGCAAFNAMPVAQQLEDELKVPVVTAHSAVLWQVLMRLGIDEPLNGYGRLLRREY